MNGISTFQLSFVSLLLFMMMVSTVSAYSLFLSPPTSKLNNLSLQTRQTTNSLSTSASKSSVPSVFSEPLSSLTTRTKATSPLISRPRKSNCRKKSILIFSESLESNSMDTNPEDIERFYSDLGMTNTEGKKDEKEDMKEQKSKEQEKGENIIVRTYNKFTSSLPDKKQLLSLGASAVCSYGLVSNINYCATMITAWIIHGRRTGLSPLAPGQWKEFLVIYGALWAGMNFLRPLRIWLSMFVTPFFDRVTDTIQDKTGLNKRISFLLTVFFLNICGTLTFVSSGLVVATRIANVPLFPPKV